MKEEIGGNRTVKVEEDNNKKLLPPPRPPKQCPKKKNRLILSQTLLSYITFCFPYIRRIVSTPPKTYGDPSTKGNVRATYGIRLCSVTKRLKRGAMRLFCLLCWRQAAYYDAE